MWARLYDVLDRQLFDMAVQEQHLDRLCDGAFHIGWHGVPASFGITGWLPGNPGAAFFSPLSHKAAK